MKTIKALVLAMATFQALGLVLGPIGMPVPAAAVSAPSGIDARIRLDWEAGTKRGGKATSTTTTAGRPPTSTCWWRRSTPPAR
jgi:hypothetical protein